MSGPVHFLKAMLRSIRPHYKPQSPCAPAIEQMEEESRIIAAASASAVHDTAERAIQRVISRHNRSLGIQL